MVDGGTVTTEVDNSMTYDYVDDVVNPLASTSSSPLPPADDEEEAITTFTKQPFVDVDRGLVALFNGEIYNYLDFGDFQSDGECLLPLYLKSGTDFRDLTTVNMQFHDDPVTGKCTVTIPDKPEHEVIDSHVEEDKETKEVVDSFLSLLGSEMEKVIGFTNVSLEARFQKVRTQETNLGNFVADAMRRGTATDIAILNSGTLRADCVMPAGDLKMKDLCSILPMVDETCTILMTGDQLKTALENGVSQYPRLEGRFPQVSGVEFSFDASLPPKSRILPGF